MLDHQQVDSIELGASEAAAVLDTDRVEPELRLVRRTFGVNVRRFLTIARVEKESVGADPEYMGN